MKFIFEALIFFTLLSVFLLTLREIINESKVETKKDDEK